MNIELYRELESDFRKSGIDSSVLDELIKLIASQKQKHRLQQPPA
jgi:hypothetical protein